MTRTLDVPASFKSASLIVQVSKCFVTNHCDYLTLNHLDLVDYTEESMNITKQMFLSSHHQYEEQTLRENDRKVIKLEGKGWVINDLFAEYYVINETKYLKTPHYEILKLNDQTNSQSLEHACFAFIDADDVNL